MTASRAAAPANRSCARSTARELTFSVVVVSRIFGGTKLGVGGLVRAYGGAAGAVLEQATIETVIAVRRFTLTYPYELSGPVDGVLAAAGVAPGGTAYGERIERAVEVPAGEAEAFLGQLAERTAGRVTVVERE